VLSRANEDELRRRIVNGSREPDDFRQLAGLLTTAGQTGAALDVLEQALMLPLDTVARAEILAQLAWLLRERTTQIDRARMLADNGLTCLAGEPETPEGLFARGMLQSLLAHDRFAIDTLGGTEMARAALATFERLFSAHPDWDEEEAWLEAGRLYCSVGDGQRAVSLAQRFLQADLEQSRRLDGLLLLSEGHRLAGRLPEAEPAAAEALRLSEGHPEVLHAAAHQLGLVQKEIGRLADARQRFEQALAALDVHPLLQNDLWWRRALHGRLAEVYDELGEHSKAISAWRELLAWYADDDPTRVRVLLWLAGACDAAGAFADARTWYEAVLATPLASDEDRAEARVWALWSEGQLQCQAGEHEAAARAFERLLDYYRDDDSDRRKVLRWLGDCYYSAGKFARARERYDEIATSPRAAEAEKGGAQQWADRSVGRFHYDAGRYAEAAQLFERVLDRLADTPDRCECLLWLAACYLQMGAYGAARHCYEEVLRAPQATEDQRANARQSVAALQPMLE